MLHTETIQNDSTSFETEAANPLVSAVVLSWNRQEETLQCLSSLKEQTYENMEIVVLENGSTDGSEGAIREHFPEARLICMPRNYGDWQGRDIAASNCKGEFLLQIDSDAELERDAVEKMVHRILKEPELGIIQPRIVDTKTGTPYDMGFGRNNTDVDFYRSVFHGCTALIRLSAYREAGGFPHYLLGGGEIYLSCRLLNLRYRILYFTGTTARHAMSPRQRIPSQRYFLQNMQRLRAILASYPGLFRPGIEFFWKLAVYTVGAFRRKQILRLPADLLKQSVLGFHAWWTSEDKISRDTLHLIDYLNCHLVRTAGKYESISTEQASFADLIRRRLLGSRSFSASRTQKPVQDTQI